MSFFKELKRRNVVRVAIAYAVAAWVLLQIADLVLQNIVAPGWIIRVMMLVILPGFIASVVIAWAYKLTPDGEKRQSENARQPSTAVGDLTEGNLETETEVPRQSAGGFK